MKLSKEQKEGVIFLRNKRKAVLEYGCRMGKSLTALNASINLTAVVCPPALVPSWEKEIKNYRDFFNGINNIIIVKNNEKKKIARLKLDTLIIDEAHENSKWKTSEFLIRLAKRTEYVYFLTATLLRNRPIDLYWPLKICEVHNLSHRDFAIRYNGAYVGYRNITILKDPTNTEELNRLKEKAVLSKDRKLNIIKENCYIGKAPAETNELIKFSAFENIIGISKANNKLTKVYLNEIVKKHKKVLIMYFHKDIVEMINKRDFPNINGSVPIKRRYQIINNFKKTKKAILFLNYISCGRGLDIPADACIFLEKQWSSNLDYQAYMRAYGYKRDKPLYLYYILYKDEKRLAVTLKKNHKNLSNFIKGGHYGK